VITYNHQHGISTKIHMLANHPNAWGRWENVNLSLVVEEYVKKIQAIFQNASKFIMCFIRFWVKLNIFTMVKMANPLITMDKWIH
jgi:hypothetical protein